MRDMIHVETTNFHVTRVDSSITVYSIYFVSYNQTIKNNKS